MDDWLGDSLPGDTLLPAWSRNSSMEKNIALCRHETPSSPSQLFIARFKHEDHFFRRFTCRQTGALALDDPATDPLTDPPLRTIKPIPSRLRRQKVESDGSQVSTDRSQIWSDRCTCIQRRKKSSSIPFRPLHSHYRGHLTR